MTIKNSKECTFRPSLTLFGRWFHYIENDGDPIFIIISDYTLIGIGCIPWNNSILSDRAFSWFKVWKGYSVRILNRLITKEDSINISYSHWLPSLCICWNLWILRQGTNRMWIELVVIDIAWSGTMTSWHPIWETFDFGIRNRSLFRRYLFCYFLRLIRILLCLIGELWKVLLNFWIILICRRITYFSICGE